jgi:diguanylate cyclase (GGDEF)-like protein
VANRQAIDHRIEERISRGADFCVILIDLNGFKQLNDTYGHSAGDDLLKQFASEMSVLFRAGDLVGRWGGDEFLVVVDASLQEAVTLSNLVRTWAFGDYKVAGAGQSIPVHVTGAIGVAAWNSRESAVELFNRADKAMYSDKENVLRGGKANGDLVVSARAGKSGPPQSSAKLMASLKLQAYFIPCRP